MRLHFFLFSVHGELENGLFLLVESGIRNPESGKFLLLESEILGFGIRNTAIGIRNPTYDWNLESKFR